MIHYPNQSYCRIILSGFNYLCIGFACERLQFPYLAFKVSQYEIFLTADYKSCSPQASFQHQHWQKQHDKAETTNYFRVEIRVQLLQLTYEFPCISQKLGTRCCLHLWRCALRLCSLESLRQLLILQTVVPKFCSVQGTQLYAASADIGYCIKSARVKVISQRFTISIG